MRPPPRLPGADVIAGHSFLPPCLLLRRAGSGAMGEVYEAWNVVHNRRVAVKVKTHGGSADRLYLEAVLGAKDLGPHVVRAYDVRRAGAFDFIEMEWVEGTSLDRLATQGLDEQELCTLAVDVCTGLAAVHAAGVVHRDIKPANILVNSEGVALVSDLGVAQSDEALDAHTHAAIGTRLYMSPEQRRAEDLDGRSDIYSFGLSLYAVLGGFLLDSRSGALRKLIDAGPPPALREAAPEVDARLAAIVDHCLSREPEQRPQTALDVRAALLALGWERRRPSSTARTVLPDPPKGLVRAALRRMSEGATDVPVQPAHDDDALRSTMVPPRRRARWPFLVLGTAAALVLGQLWRPGASEPVRGAGRQDGSIDAEGTPRLREHGDEFVASSEPSSPERLLLPGDLPLQEPPEQVPSEQVPLEPVLLEQVEPDTTPPTADLSQATDEATPAEDWTSQLDSEDVRSEATVRYRPRFEAALADSVHRPTFVRVGDRLVQETEVSRGLWLLVLGDDPRVAPNERFLPQLRVGGADAERFVARLNDLLRKDATYRFAVPTRAEFEEIHEQCALGSGAVLESLAQPRDTRRAGYDPTLVVGDPSERPRLSLAPAPVQSAHASAFGLRGLLGNAAELAFEPETSTWHAFGGSERDRAKGQLSLPTSEPRTSKLPQAWDGLRLVIEPPRT